MEISQELDEFIKNSIDDTLGLTVPDQALQLKLESLETIKYRLREQYLALQSKLKEKETALELARNEATLNAQAVKKFVEENQKIANECKHLVGQCRKWEHECSLYDHDREALMEFGNEADERAKVAEIRVHELEEELKTVSDQLKHYKHQYETLSPDSAVDGPPSEQILLNALVASLMNKNEVAKTASAFLEANSGVETCSELLKLWNSLSPETLNVLALAARVKTLQKEKEHLRTNLSRAEDEVNVLAEENGVLVQENKRLSKVCHSGRKRTDSGEKRDSTTKTKSNKRKNSPGLSSPVERKIDFNDTDALRFPLSPLQENSPGSKAHKK